MPRVPAFSVRTRIRLQAHVAAVQTELLGRLLVWPDGFEVPCSALRAFGSADGGQTAASLLDLNCGKSREMISLMAEDVSCFVAYPANPLTGQNQ
jgi:hypothetical protein